MQYATCNMAHVSLLYLLSVLRNQHGYQYTPGELKGASYAETLCHPAETLFPTSSSAEAIPIFVNVRATHSSLSSRM